MASRWTFRFINSSLACTHAELRQLFIADLVIYVYWTIMSKVSGNHRHMLFHCSSIFSNSTAFQIHPPSLLHSVVLEPHHFWAQLDCSLLLLMYYLRRLLHRFLVQGCWHEGHYVANSLPLLFLCVSWRTHSLRRSLCSSIITSWIYCDQLNDAINKPAQIGQSPKCVLSGSRNRISSHESATRSCFAHVANVPTDIYRCKLQYRTRSKSAHFFNLIHQLLLCRKTQHIIMSANGGLFLMYDHIWCSKTPYKVLATPYSSLQRRRRCRCRRRTRYSCCRCHWWQIWRFF